MIINSKNVQKSQHVVLSQTLRISDRQLLICMKCPHLRDTLWSGKWLPSPLFTSAHPTSWLGHGATELQIPRLLSTRAQPSSLFHNHKNRSRLKFDTHLITPLPELPVVRLCPINFHQSKPPSKCEVPSWLLLFQRQSIVN